MIDSLLQSLDAAARWVDPYVGLLALIPIGLTFWEVWFGRARRHRRWFTEVRREAGERPAILIVDLLPGREIIAQVEGYRQSNEVLRNVPNDRVFRISAADLGYNDANLPPEIMIKLHNKLYEAIHDMWRAGTSVIHYFHSGPLPTVAMVGAALANGPMVQMYHWRVGHYESWGPMRHTHHV